MPTLIIFILPLIIFSTWGIAASAQNAAEWWSQNKTRIQYLEQQVAILAAFKKTIEKGYKTAEDGIHDISNTKEEEYNLHYTFFKSQGVLHTAGKYGPEISGIMALYTCLHYEMATAAQEWAFTPWLHPSERSEIDEEFGEQSRQAIKNIDRLRTLVEEGQLKMLDGERVEAIRAIGEDAGASLSFILWFKEDTNDLIEEREEGSGDIYHLKHLFP
jgi:hypothetical protein